ncbi:MAG: glycosyltransferase [Candidatus Heimdallarchaeota archaeon]|nr:glycosyltransferase [Candidatus Heimdallarchaeota archaeon]
MDTYEELEKKKFSKKLKERFHRVKIGLKNRLFQFTIVSLVGLGINTLMVYLTELIMYKYWPHLSEVFIPIGNSNLFNYSIIGFVALIMGIAFATTSNFLFNKFWTFRKAKSENFFLQFLKYALVGGSGAVLKLFLTSGLIRLFLLFIPLEKYALIPSTIVAFIVTVFWNYFWNEFWTFEVMEKRVEEPVTIPIDMNYNEVTIITPTFNENENIGPLMDLLSENFPDVNLIVADDGSQDGTREQVRAFSEKNPSFRLLDREAEEIHGLTISVIDAIKLTETPFFIVMDCDFQHPPEKAAEIAVKLKEGYHFVVGERDEIPDWPFKRRLISWGASVIGKFSLWIHRSATCGDVMSGFFGADTRYAQMIIGKHPKGFRPKGYKIMFELLKHSRRKETKVGRVGYTFNPRIRGESKISKKHIIEFLKSAFP